MKKTIGKVFIHISPLNSLTTKIVNKLFNCCLLFIPISFLFVSVHSEVFASTFSARSVAEKYEVFVGEPFIFQIQIEGNDSPDKPDLSVIDDFSIQDRGGQSNSSSSVTIINGQLTRNVKKGYIFSYRFVAKRTGNLEIPPITVVAGNESVNTRPLMIRSIKPKETDDFKLKLELSSNRVYTGQPVTLTVKWYIGKDVESFHFGIPLLSDERFYAASVEPDVVSANRSNYIPIPLETGEIIGEKSQEELNGKTYMTLMFSFILIPKKSGKIDIPQATVSFSAVMGYDNRQRSRSPFDSFFSSSDFFSNRRKRVQKFVVPSNEPAINIIPVPKAGKPANFNGLVGKYSLTASAVPVEVNVGDPITLTINITGEKYLENVELPPLNEQPMISRNFKIPKLMSPGKIKNGVKSFTQTIRAKNSDVKAIPPIELPYFNVNKGEYEIARSKPINISVKSTRIVTASDAEGLKIDEEDKVELETELSGIAHNYEDISVLENNKSGVMSLMASSGLKLVIIIPPTLFFLLLFLKYSIVKSKSDPEGKKYRRAFSLFEKGVADIRKNISGNKSKSSSDIMDLFKNYLGSKLGLAPGTITFIDVKDMLKERKVDDETLSSLERFFEDGEASRFGGNVSGSINSSDFIENALHIAKRIERSIV